MVRAILFGCVPVIIFCLLYFMTLFLLSEDENVYAVNEMLRERGGTFSKFGVLWFEVPISAAKKKDFSMPYMRVSTNSEWRIVN